MTLALPSVRPIAIFGALAWTTLTIGTAIAPAPVQAADGPYYRAELTAPAATGHCAATAPRRQIGQALAGGLVWKCAETVCAAQKGTSRPAIVCARLAKEVGAVANFTAGGKALEAKDLARCNAG